MLPQFMFIRLRPKLTLLTGTNKSAPPAFRQAIVLTTTTHLIMYVTTLKRPFFTVGTSSLTFLGVGW